MNPAQLLNQFQVVNPDAIRQQQALAQQQAELARQAQIKTQQEQQAQADEAQIRSMAGKTRSMEDLAGMIEKVNPRAGLALRTAIAARNKSDADLAESQAKTQKAQLESRALQIQQHANALGSITDDASKTAALQSMVQGGILDPQRAAQINAMPFNSPEFQTLLQQGKQEAVDALGSLKIEGEKLLNRGRAADAAVAEGTQQSRIDKAATDAATSAVASRVAGATEADQIAKAAADAQRAQGQAAQEQVNPATGLTANQEASNKLRSREVQNQIDKLYEERRHNLKSEGIAALNVEGAELSEDAKNKMAEMFATTGQLPALGMGKQASAMRSEIINRAAKNFPQVDFATAKASYQANLTSLRNLQGLADRVDAFESTAGKNIDIFLKSAKEIIDTGSPLLNKPVRAVADALGSTKQAAFETARETALTEAAKVIESPSDGSSLSVSGRNAVKTLSSPDATLGQQIEAMKVLRQDMASRKQANTEQIKAITDRISGGNSSAPAVGTVDGGYRFKGGNPADQKNWEKVQ